jgi:hypothetical protein
MIVGKAEHLFRHVEHERLQNIENLDLGRQGGLSAIVIE